VEIKLIPIKGTYSQSALKK